MQQNTSHDNYIASYFFTFFICLCQLTAFAQDTSSLVHVLTIDGPIGPASHSYLHRQLVVANAKEADLVVVKLNTPGGLVTSMRSMARSIMDSPVPVAVYVSPRGAHAASAGAFLVYAAHVAAMAPGTNVGAATPIPLAGEAGEMPRDPDEKDSVKLAPVAQVKTLEDLTAFMRSLAQYRGRNIDVGVAMVRNGLSLSATEALDRGVIDYLTPSLEDLIEQAGQKIVLVKGKAVKINTANPVIVNQDPDWRNQMLTIITNPNITYILLLIGIYGVLLEFYNPGTFYPGIIGAICLILAGYSLTLLPVNVAGLALILLGITFLLFESITPSYGIFGIGGIVAFVIGSVFLLDTHTAFFQINSLLIGTMSLLTLSFFLLLIRMIVSAMRSPPLTGVTSLIGKECVALSSFLDDGEVLCEGIIYRASCMTPVEKDQKLIVDDASGNKLFVRSIPPSETT